MDSNGWRKPYRGALLNPAHPLTRGLVFCPLLAEGSGTYLHDSSGRRNHGALTYGGTWRPTPYGWGIDFDGVDDGAVCGTGCSNIWAGEGTLIAIIKPDSGGYLSQGTVACTGRGNVSPGWRLYTAAATEVRFQVWRATTPGLWTALDLNASGWSHVALTYDSDSVANDPLFYLDGVCDTLIVESNTPVGSYNDDTGGALCFGNNTDGSREYDGQQAGVWLFDHMLTASEIIAHRADPWGMFVGRTSAGVFYVTPPAPERLLGGRKPIRIAA